MVAKPETDTERILIESLSSQFLDLYYQWCSLVNGCSENSIYREVRSSDGVVFPPVGEMILRSAAVVEQTFGGLTANLWDDPFEWTLPETLSTPEKVSDYLNEVEATRKRGFELFQSDDDLLRKIMAPAGATRLQPLLLDTLA